MATNIKNIIFNTSDASFCFDQYLNLSVNKEFTIPASEEKSCKLDLLNYDKTKGELTINKLDTTKCEITDSNTISNLFPPTMKNSVSDGGMELEFKFGIQESETPVELTDIIDELFVDADIAVNITFADSLSVCLQEIL